MAHNSNSLDAPWLPNSQTEMFSVYAGNARSSCRVVGEVANSHTRACCTEALDRRNCCVSVGRSTLSTVGMHHDSASTAPPFDNI